MMYRLRHFVLLSLACAIISAAAFPDSPAQKLFESASRALRNGDYAGAEAGFPRVLQAEPNNLGAVGNLGVVYSRTLRYAKAIEIYRRALNLSPREPGILLNLGLAYLKQDDYLGKAKLKLGDASAAVTLLQQAAQLNPDDPSVFYLLASGLKALGRTEEAEVALRRVTELHANSLNTEKKALQDLNVVGTR
jgi:Flp pilus assembly protein TadD